MPRKAEPVVVDSQGTPLQTGDRVVSIRRFDRSHIHKGVITQVNTGSQRISVRHKKGCCETGLHSEDCDPQFWLVVIRRPTSWARILRD